METSQQIITKIKIKELFRQRTYLKQEYHKIEQIYNEKEGDLDKFLILEDGLKQIKFAGQLIHPMVSNLDLIRQQIIKFPEKYIAYWHEKLLTELRQGHIRTEMVYIFGKLIEEWVQNIGQLSNDSSKESHLIQRSILENMTKDVAVSDEFKATFDRIIDKEDTKSLLEKKDRLYQTIHEWELNEILQHISGNIYISASLKSEAKEILNNNSNKKELLDTLTILLSDIENWKWAEPIETKLLWTRNKWRLYIDEDLVTFCFLELIGRRYCILMDENNERVRIRRERLMRLIEIKAPEVILENERKMLSEVLNETELAFYRNIESHEKLEKAKNDSIIEQRKQSQINIRSLIAKEDSDTGYQADTNSLISLLNAEIQLHKSISPGKELFVAKVDIKDYYASVPKEVAIYLLKKIGFEEKELNFIEQFLSLTVTTDGITKQTNKGLPLNHHLSIMLAELILRIMEQFVQEEVKVNIIRKVDDIFIIDTEESKINASLKRIEDFFLQCGLEINKEKSGSQIISSNTVEKNINPVRFGLLELTSNGDWIVNKEAFKAHIAQTRERVIGSSSIFKAVSVFNANFRYLMQMLFIDMNLGSLHRNEIEKHLLIFYEQLISTDIGIVDWLKEKINKLAFEFNEKFNIPDAWIFWPLTAGGLGLQNPLVLTGLYSKVIERHQAIMAPIVIEDGWDVLNNEWSNYYKSFFKKFEYTSPVKDHLFDSLVNDFIRRGREISGGSQNSLSDYWQWILYLYGTQLMEEFGTLRFLMTELVPLHLIFNQLNEDNSL